MSRRIHRGLWAVGVGLSACVLGGCPTTFQVTFPTALQTTSQDFDLANGKIRIRVVFNKPVDMSTLDAGNNVILVAETTNNADITITAGSTGTDIIITTVDDASDLLVYDPDGFFSLELLGTGDNPIKSTDGDVLDGDGDGTAGGDYQTGFAVIG